MNLELVTRNNGTIRATSDAQGRFRFAVRKSEFDCVRRGYPMGLYATILARAPGFAFGMANDRNNGSELILQLARDDVPGYWPGRRPGRPSRRRRRVTVLNVRAPATPSLDAWLKALDERKGFLERQIMASRLELPSGQSIIPSVKSGSDGRFVISGIGRERVAELEISGETLETVRVDVRTRPGATIRVPGPQGQPANEPITIYAATFEHVAGPTRPIEGVVRDRDTRAPLSGIMVRGERSFGNQSLGNSSDYVSTITDAQGHYRLVGLPRGREGDVVAVPPVNWLAQQRPATIPPARDEGLPYLRARVKVGDPGGREPVKLDINLKRGIWVTGRVLEEDTRKPARAQVEYFVFADNPHLDNGPDFRWSMIPLISRGAMASSISSRSRAPGRSRPARRTFISRLTESTLSSTNRRTGSSRPSLLPRSNKLPCRRRDRARPGYDLDARDLLLHRGRSLTVSVLGPDGKPLTGNQVAGLKDMGYWETPRPEDSTYTIISLRPGKGRTLTFLNRARGLTGELVLDGNESSPQTITLQPWGVLKGRIVDAQGEPSTEESQLSPFNLPGGYPKIGKDGRFRVEGLVPGKSYTLRLLDQGYVLHNFVVKDLKVGAGEVKDLGDILPRP